MKVRGAENEPTREQGTYLVIANHRTWADPIYLCCVLKHGQPHFMAKKELFKIPLLNLLIRALGAYPVNRGGADVGAIKHTIEMLKAGVCVGMFPQGHRYNKVDPRKTPVKTGAAMIALKAGVPVLPVFIKVKNNKHFFLCRKEVIVGKPISIEEMNYDPEAPGEYQRVADYLFERVCELGD
jgi:1-acyl-sn-glycerol-3-phosphate acyltransferase